MYRSISTQPGHPSLWLVLIAPTHGGMGPENFISQLNQSREFHPMLVTDIHCPKNYTLLFSCNNFANTFYIEIILAHIYLNKLGTKWLKFMNSWISLEEYLYNALSNVAYENL